MGHIPFWQKLRWQIGLSNLLLTTLPLVVVASLILNQTSSRIQNQSFEQLNSVSELKVAQIDNFLEDGLNSLEHLTETSLLREVLIATFNDPSPENLAIVRDLLQGVQESEIFVSEIFIYTPEGKIIADTNPNNIGKVVTLQPYFEHSLTTPNHVQSPFYDVGFGNLTLVATTPLTREEHEEGEEVALEEVIGVVGVRLNITVLGEIMATRTGLGKTGETYLISPDNNYLLTPSRFEGNELNRAYRSQGIDAALRGENGQGSYDDYRNPGVPVFGVYRWLPNLQVALIAEIDEAEVSQDVRSALTQGALITLGFMLLAILVGLFLANRTAQPLQELTQAATALAQGDLQQRVGNYRGEAGQVAKSFNYMASQLEQNIQELQTATNQAQEAARLKSEFLANMSHELRTPLNAILGFTGIMLEGMGGELDQDAIHMVKRVEANSKRLLGLINDVLDIAKIEAGRLDLVHEPIQLHHLIEQWHTEMSVLAQRKNLNFVVEVDPALPKQIYGDSARLTQIATNLLGNAFKFTEQGQVKLKIRSEEKFWSLQVNDTGVGIPSHALNYIFDEFRQVDGSSKRKFGGTGLGLTITRNLCLMMRGNIRVESDLGKGSTFTVTLPLVTVPMDKKGV